MRALGLVGIFLLGLLAGVLIVQPADAQTAIQLYGTVQGTANTPIALVADADGALVVSCAP